MFLICTNVKVCLTDYSAMMAELCQKGSENLPRQHGLHGMPKNNPPQYLKIDWITGQGIDMTTPTR